MERFRWQVLLPPHTGTGTFRNLLGKDLGIKTCRHEHTVGATQEVQLQHIVEFCNGERSQGPDSLLLEICNVTTDIPYRVILERNPYARVDQIFISVCMMI
jgi:hypothetical protein